MKKAFRFVFTMLVCLSVLSLTGCKDTSALKASIEEASKACPINIDNLGQATAVTMGENEVTFAVTPLPSFLENDKVDHSLIARYLILELQRKNPDLVKQMVEAELGVKVDLNSGGAEPEKILVAADELKKFSGEFLASGGQAAPILLPLYNQQLSAKLPLEISEGLKLTKVKAVDGTETFFFSVDDDKTKFADIRSEIIKNMEKAEEKVKLSKVNLSLVLPLLNELNYSAMFRYSTKAGNETYMELTSEEIKNLLNPAPAEEEEKK